jgi:hypothetical protein
MLILSIVLAIPSAIYITNASTVTTTITRTLTEYMTTIISQTIWRTSTYTSTITSPITNTRTKTITTNPIITQTIDLRSTTTVYVPITTIFTLPPIQLLKVYTIPENPEMGSIYGLYFNLKNNDPTNSHEVNIRVIVTGEFHPEASWELNLMTETVGYGAVTLILKPGEGPVTSSISLKSKWNWIPGSPLNAVSLAEKLVAILRALGGPEELIAGKIFTIANILQKAEEAKKSILYVTFALEQSSDSTIPFRKDVRVTVPEWKKKAFVWSVTIAAASITGTLLLSSFGIPGWLAILGFTAAQIIAYLIAADPSGDYTTVASPPKIIVPELDAIPEGVNKQLALSALDFLSYFNATATSLIRYSAASLAGEESFMRMQVEAASKYIHQSYEKFNEFIRLTSKISTGIPAPSSSQIKEFKQSLQGGLPSYAQKVLEALGLEEYASYIPSYLVETDEANFMLPLDPLLTAANENMKGMIQSIEDVKTKCVSPIQRYIPYVFIPLLIIAASLGTYFVKTRFAKKRPKVKEVISLLKVKRNSIS